MSSHVVYILPRSPQPFWYDVYIYQSGETHQSIQKMVCTDIVHRIQLDAICAPREEGENEKRAI